MVSRDGDLTKAQDQWIGARVTSDAHQNLSEGQQAGFACLNVTQQGGLRSGSVFSSARRRRDYWTFLQVTGAGGLSVRMAIKRRLRKFAVYDLRRQIPVHAPEAVLQHRLTGACREYLPIGEATEASHFQQARF